MTSQIKTFIESNITIIAEQDWHTVFDKYYTACFWFDTEEVFNELMNVLKVVDPYVITHSREARSTVLFQGLNQIFHEELEGMTYASSSEFKKSYLTDQLNSWLGFTEGEVEQIADNVAETYGLEVDFDCYYVR